MALPENVPTATLDLDRPRTLALTLGAMRRIKETTGTSITQLGETGLEVENIGAYVWSMLVNEDRDVSRDDVEEMLHLGNLQEVSDTLTSLFGDGEGAEGNAKPAKKPAKAKS